MKKVNLLVIVLALIISSCSSDDGDSNNVSESIIGTWKLISDIEDEIEWVEDGDCDILYIITAATITEEYYEGIDCSEVDLTDSTWPYSIENNVIIGFYTEGNEEETFAYDYEIISLTKATLIVEYTDEDYVNTMTLERQ